MMPLAGGVRVYLATGVTDMRKSINTLSILVAEQMDLDPLSGHLFAFCNRKRDTLKILYWDRNGFCLWHKRLEQHRLGPREAPLVAPRNRRRHAREDALEDVVGGVSREPQLPVSDADPSSSS